jgi:chemosensory pili system protein ChpA (sensor histidine kinase/response regulator)
MQPEQQQRIMGYFIEEAKDHLSTIEQGLLNLQSTMGDPEMVNELFRAAHSVKGGAAMLGLNSIMRVAHRLEDFFKILKESAIRVDQKLETLFLQVFDALQELLGQLQGPFGLTDEAAASILSGVEPTFEQLEEHLELLAGSTAKPAAQPVASTPALQDSQVTLIFSRDVPVYLRNMLQLFKQAEDPFSRQQLEEICSSLAQIGQQFNLSTWSNLIEIARGAIANPDNPYRNLAPLVIRDIKQAQELVLAGRLSEICACTQLQDLAPTVTVSDVAASEMAADQELADLLTTADFTDFVVEEEIQIAASDDSLFIEVEQTIVSAPLDLGEEFEDAFSGTELGDRNGPEMGIAELNSLADLFEGEVPDLASTWQEEEILNTPSDTSASVLGFAEDDDLSDFSDLLFDPTEASQSAPSTSRDDLSALFGDDLLDEDTEEPTLVDTPKLSGLISSEEWDDDDLAELVTFSLDAESSPSDNTEFSSDLGLAGLDSGTDNLGLDLIDPEELLGMEFDQEQQTRAGTSLEGLGELFAGMDDTDLSFTELQSPADTSSPTGTDDISSLDLSLPDTEPAITEDELNAFADLWDEASNQVAQADATQQPIPLDPWEEPGQDNASPSDPLTETFSVPATEDISLDLGEFDSDTSDLGELDLGELNFDDNAPVADFPTDLFDRPSDAPDLSDSTTLEPLDLSLPDPESLDFDESLFGETSGDNDLTDLGTLDEVSSIDFADLQLDEPTTSPDIPELTATGEEAIDFDESLFGETSGDNDLTNLNDLSEELNFEELNLSALQLDEPTTNLDIPELTVGGEESIDFDESLFGEPSTDNELIDLGTGDESLDFDALQLDEPTTSPAVPELSLSGEESLDFDESLFGETSGDNDLTNLNDLSEELNFEELNLSALQLDEPTTNLDIPELTVGGEESIDFDESLFGEPSTDNELIDLGTGDESLDFDALQLDEPTTSPAVPELSLSGEESLDFDESLFGETSEDADLTNLNEIGEELNFEELNFGDLQLEETVTSLDMPELTATDEELLSFDESLFGEPSTDSELIDLGTVDDESLDFDALQLDESTTSPAVPELSLSGEESLDFDESLFGETSEDADLTNLNEIGEELNFGDLQLEETVTNLDMPELTATGEESLSFDASLFGETSESDELVDLSALGEESLDFGDLQLEESSASTNIPELTATGEELLSFDESVRGEEPIVFDTSLFGETSTDTELSDLGALGEETLDFGDLQLEETVTNLDMPELITSDEESIDFGELSLFGEASADRDLSIPAGEESLDFGDLQLEETVTNLDMPELTVTGEESLSFDESLFGETFGDNELGDLGAIDEAPLDFGDLQLDEVSASTDLEPIDFAALDGFDDLTLSDSNEASLESSLDDLFDQQPPLDAESELTDLDILLNEETEPAIAAEPSDLDGLFGAGLDAGSSDNVDGLSNFLDQEADSSDFDTFLNLEQDTGTTDLEDLDSFLGQELTSNAEENLADLGDLEGFLSQETTSEEDFSNLENLLGEDTSINGSDFADLDNLIGADFPASEVIASSQITDLPLGNNLSEDFADLEALLGGETGEATVVQPVSRPVGPEAEFDELDELLKDAEEKMGGTPTMKIGRGAAPQTRRPARQGRVFSEQTMRVPVKHLDNLSNLVGELVVNRNSLEQDQERLRQSLDNLLYQVQQLSDVGQRMQDLYERSLLESSLLASRHGGHRIASSLSHTRGGDSHPQPDSSTGVEYDPLEMDRFTGFHSLSQEMIELIVRVRESASDIEFIVDETDQVTRMFRQVTTQLQEGLTRSRMVPFAQTADRLPRAVRDISIKVGKQAELNIEGRETLIDKMILEQLYDPMTHLVNNALTHGIEPPEVRRAANKPPAGRITVRAFHQGNQTIISVSDDGAGIDVDRVKAKAIEKGLVTPSEARFMSRLDIYDLLFQAGFSTKDQADDFSGRGVGMDVVRTSLSEIRGTITTDSTPGKGTTFTIRLPLTLSISKALCCISDRARIAFPMDGVEDMLDVPKDRIQTNAEGQPCISWRDSFLPLRPLTELLGYNRQLSRGSVYGGSQEDDIISIVVLRSAGNFLALQVDQVLGEQEIVIKQLEGPVPKPIGIAGATVLGDGRIMPIADVLELIDLSMGRIRKDAGGSLWEQAGGTVAQEAPALKTEPMVLIVDDSITVRELLSMTFNKVGYRVEQARDGQEAWEKLRSGLPCDIVFCDIEMPRMDGLELLSRIQKDPNLSHLPIAMLTSRGADRHRQMAASLGASGYFTKPYLEEALLDAAQRMLKGEKLIGSGS